MVGRTGLSWTNTCADYYPGGNLISPSFCHRCIPTECSGSHSAGMQRSVEKEYLLPFAAFRRNATMQKKGYKLLPKGEGTNVSTDWSVAVLYCNRGQIGLCALCALCGKKRMNHEEHEEHKGTISCRFQY